MAVTSAQLQQWQLGITRVKNVTEADANTILINAGTETEFQFVSNLLSQARNTSEVVVAVEASMYGVAPSSASLDSLTTTFLPAQISNAIKNGYNPRVYAAETVGLALNSKDGAGSTAFATNFGPANAAMPNSGFGDSVFSGAISNAIFGTASTPALVTFILGATTAWKNFYTKNGVPGITGATADQIDLAARGAATGDAVGVALENNLGPLLPNTVNFLEDAAQLTAIYSAAITVPPQPQHTPFGGESAAGTGVTAVLTIVNGDNLGPTATGPNAQLLTNFDDTIIAPVGTFQAGDFINGGGGFDVISGGFVDVAGGISPVVQNVERVNLMADAAALSGQMNFTGYTGLQEANVVGNGGAGDVNTTFNQLPLAVKVGITNYSNVGNATATFIFAGATGAETADLTVNKAGVFGTADPGPGGGNEAWFVMNGINTINLHVGAGGANLSNAAAAVYYDSLVTMNIDGSGNIRFDPEAAAGTAPLLKVLNAKNLTGALSYDYDGTKSQTVTVGSGGSQIETAGTKGDTLNFGAGADIYSPGGPATKVLSNFSGATLGSTADWDVAGATINFFGTTDKIDFSGAVEGIAGTTAASGRIYIATGLQNAAVSGLASVEAAALFIAANDGIAPGGAPVVDVFEYKGSTYVWYDGNDNETFLAGGVGDTFDGGIKIAGVLGITLANFV